MGKHSRGFGLEASLFEKPVLGAGEAEVFPQGFAFVFAAEEAAPLPRCRRTRRRGRRAGFGWWVGRTPSWCGGLQPFMEATPVACCSCSKSAAKSPALVAADRSRSTVRSRGAARTLIRLFYQVEIRHHQIPSSKIPDPLTAAGVRDRTTRLWQLRGCYVELLDSRQRLRRPMGVFDGGGRECASFGY